MGIVKWDLSTSGRLLRLTTIKFRFKITPGNKGMPVPRRLHPGFSKTGEDS